MREFYIPKIGDEIELSEPWEFKLFREQRNKKLFAYLGIAEEVNYQTRNKFIKTILQKGTRLKIERIYIRVGQEEFDSITFLITNVTIKHKPRFWVKLEDANGGIKFNFIDKETETE